MNIDINEKYQPLFDNENKNRYFVITGGRGSSKSFSVALKLLLLTYEKGHKVLFTRYTMISAHSSIIPEFIEKIELLGKEKDFRITKDEIINLTTGSLIMFKGIKTSSGNQTAALKSLNGVTTFVVDEAEELVDEVMFDKIDLSVRSKTHQNRCILILNPTTREHWIYKRFFEQAEVEEGSNRTKGDTTYIHTTFKDNERHLPDSFLKRIYDIKKFNPMKYEHQILGGWLAKPDGVVFDNYEVGDFRETESMCFGQDFGFSEDPTTLIKVAVDIQMRTMYVKESVVKKAMSASEIAQKNKMYAGNQLIICDNAEPRLIKNLKDRGLNIRPTIKKAGTILSGIALMQDFRIVIDRDSKEIQREFNNYVWKENGIAPIDKYNHCIDAIRYAVMYLAKNRRSGQYSVL